MKRDGTTEKRKRNPRTITDEELLEALLEHNGSPSATAVALGMGASTIARRIGSPTMKTLIRDYRMKVIDALALAMADGAEEAVKTLRGLMSSGTPQDSVKLGAATTMLKLATLIRRDDLAFEELPDVWESAPKFVPRLVTGDDDGGAA